MYFQTNSHLIFIAQAISTGPEPPPTTPAPAPHTPTSTPSPTPAPHTLPSEEPSGMPSPTPSATSSPLPATTPDTSSTPAHIHTPVPLQPPVISARGSLTSRGYKGYVVVSLTTESTPAYLNYTTEGTTPTCNTAVAPPPRPFLLTATAEVRVCATALPCACCITLAHFIQFSQRQKVNLSALVLCACAKIVKKYSSMTSHFGSLNVRCVSCRHVSWHVLMHL